MPIYRTEDRNFCRIPLELIHKQGNICNSLSLPRKVRGCPKNNTWHHGPDIAVVQEWNTVVDHSRALDGGSLEFWDFWNRGTDACLLPWESWRQRWAQVAVITRGWAGTGHCKRHIYNILNLIYAINIVYITSLGQPQRYCHLGLNNSLLWEMVLWIVRCLAASLVSSH